MDTTTHTIGDFVRHNEAPDSTVPVSGSLQVILRDEHLAPDFSVRAVAEMSEGYSGSDLHNLCVAAAYRPIRDFLAEEKKAAAAATAGSTRGGDVSNTAALPNPGDPPLAGIPVSSGRPDAGAPASDTPVPENVPPGDAAEKTTTSMPGNAAAVHASTVVDPAGDEQVIEKAAVSQQELEGGTPAAEERGDARQAARDLDEVLGSKSGALSEGEGLADDHGDRPIPGDAGVQPMEVEEKDSGAAASGRETGGARDPSTALLDVLDLHGAWQPGPDK